MPAPTMITSALRDAVSAMVGEAAGGGELPDGPARAQVQLCRATVAPTPSAM